MASTPHIVIQGLVLRETETKDADKILTLLTAERGKLSVIARGARRKNCKFAACAQSLAWSEWTLYQKGQWYYASEGATLELFNGLRSDLEAMALGFYLAELTEAVTTEENLESFGDQDQISEDAVMMMNWAVGQGILTGRTENQLAPQEAVTRAECAVMLMRCAEAVGQ